MASDCIRSFLSNVEYLIESDGYFQQLQMPPELPLKAHSLFTIIEPTAYFVGGQLREINQTIQQNEPDEKIKDLWNSFYIQAMQHSSGVELFRSYENLAAYVGQQPSDQGRLGVFKDTDLKIMADRVDSMPMTGIKELELRLAERDYKKMAELFTYDQVPPHFREATKERVLKDLRVLMSRPVGRELIRGVLEKNVVQRIQIQSGSGFEYLDLCEGGRVHQINYENRFHFDYVDSPPFGIQLKTTPSFLGLAHELIHLLHTLEGRANHEPISEEGLQELYTNNEELLTIEGHCECHGFHPIYENRFREEFELPRCYFHAHLPHALDTFFIISARRGAIRDMLAVYPQVSEELANDVLEVLRGEQGNPAAYQALFEAMYPSQLRAAVE